MPRQPVEKKRKNFGFTLDPEVYQRFKDRCESDGRNMSRVVEWLMTEYLAPKEKSE